MISMHTIKLNIHGGGRLKVHGSLSAERILVVLSRENFRQDDTLVADLIEFLVQSHFTVAHYESALIVTARNIDVPWVRHLPRVVRLPIKALSLLCRPSDWRHFSARYRAQGSDLAFRTRALRELVRFFGPGKQLVFLTRSASSRIASGIADEVGLHKLICMGYPFKHPEHDIEPARYAHLEHLQTPCLILQGTRDSYGGIDTLHHFPLAANTALQWIDTDHSFSVSDLEWRRVRDLINNFIV
jgi:uncharacterized protein